MPLRAAPFCSFISYRLSSSLFVTNFFSVDKSGDLPVFSGITLGGISRSCGYNHRGNGCWLGDCKIAAGPRPHTESYGTHDLLLRSDRSGSLPDSSRMALECVVARFKHPVRTSQKTPMYVAVTLSTTVGTRQRNSDSHCLLVTKQ
jgi:hypothetical protein